MATADRARAGGRQGTSGARRRMSQERRDALLQRLEEFFLTEGFSHLTIDSIAAHLQCSKSTLYGVASSKDQLVGAVLKRFFREATEYVEASVARAEGPHNKIAIYLASVGDRMRRMSPVCFEDMVSLESAELIYQLNARASGRRVRELIHDGVEAGAFRQVHAQFIAEATSLLIDGIMHGELLERTGLSSGDAYVVLSNMVLGTLTSDAPSGLASDGGSRPLQLAPPETRAGRSGSAD